LKTILIKLALACAPFLIAGTVQASNLDFTLVNKTNQTIFEVHVSSSSTSDWEEDVLGTDALISGDSVDIEFERGSKGCKWDLKVTYESGKSAEWGKLDLCSISTVTLSYDRKSGTTSARTK